jgi:hypothetical protein
LYIGADEINITKITTAASTSKGLLYGRTHKQGKDAFQLEYVQSQNGNNMTYPTINDIEYKTIKRTPIFSKFSEAKFIVGDSIYMSGTTQNDDKSTIVEQSNILTFEILQNLKTNGKKIYAKNKKTSEYERVSLEIVIDANENTIKQFYLNKIGSTKRSDEKTKLREQLELDMSMLGTTIDNLTKAKDNYGSNDDNNFVSVCSLASGYTKDQLVEKLQEQITENENLLPEKKKNLDEFENYVKLTLAKGKPILIKELLDNYVIIISDVDWKESDMNVTDNSPPPSYKEAVNPYNVDSSVPAPKKGIIGRSWNYLLGRNTKKNPVLNPESDSDILTDGPPTLGGRRRTIRNKRNNKKSRKGKYKKQKKSRKLFTSFYN